MSCGVVAAAALVLASDAFTTFPSRGASSAKASRMVAVRSLQMAGPRGRSTHGIAIEGADGNEAIMVASSRMPITSLERQSTYEDDEALEESATAGAEEGMDEFDLSSFTSDGAMGGGGEYLSYQQEESGERKNALDRRSATLNRKNSLILNGAIVASIGAAGWVGVTTFISRQADLVEAYADEMTYHVGNEREMGLCHKEYKKKLGPGLYREAMFKEVLLAIGQKRPSTLETVRAIKFVMKLFRANTAKTLKQIVVVSKKTDRTQSNVRAKLYFLGTILAEKDEKLFKILEPLRRRIEASFYADGPSMLKIRTNEMAEAALKAAIEAMPGDQMLESGWEELGITPERASEIASEMNDEAPLNAEAFYSTGGLPTNDEESDPDAAAMLKQLETEIEEKKTQPQDEKDPEPEGTPKSYECTVCGYKMFVAKGREFKFFGDDFKCPECGAGKSKFKEGDA